MKRSLKLERLFPLGDYKNIKFTDEVIDIPEDIVLNESLMAKIRYLQMVDIEIAFREYISLMQRVSTFKTEELAKAVEFLKQEQISTIKTIEDLFLKK